MLSPREILAYIAIKAEGDYYVILDELKKRNKAKEKDVLEELSKLKCNYYTILDPEYPDYLRRISRPPVVLFYYGDISLISDPFKNVSVVGSRGCSSYGEKITKQLVDELSSEYNIVSGLAVGIDSIAHRSTIQAKGKTIAVLASGIDYCYPLINKDIYDEIKSNHLLISEYPFAIQPKQINFPFRNRLISAFSKAVLVTESSLKSGTMITVHHALTQGRDVMCVPFPLDVESGCNELIKEGAYLVQCKRDVDEIYGKIEK